MIPLNYKKFNNKLWLQIFYHDISTTKEYYNNYDSLYFYDPNKPNKFSILINITDELKISNSFEFLIEYTEQRIPKQYIPHTHVYVYATAGMRLLTAPDRERVIEMAFNYLSTHSHYVIKRQNIKVIDGIEEGVYGWLSVNHLQGNLKNNLPTRGAIDLGGASFQIALQVADGELVNDATTVTIGPKKIRVFAHSYLFYYHII